MKPQAPVTATPSTNSEATTRRHRPSGLRIVPATTSASLACLALLALLATTGCSGDGADNSSADAHASSGSTDASTAVVASGPQMATVVARESADSSGVGGLPPDISVSSSSTMALPGDVVEITGYGTPDIESIALWDGLHDRQAFTYDAAAKGWRVQYRVPLGHSGERVALSVTARNHANRWRRVWVFLANAEQTEEEESMSPETVAQPDSGS